MAEENNLLLQEIDTLSRQFLQTPLVETGSSAPALHQAAQGLLALAAALLLLSCVMLAVHACRSFSGQEPYGRQNHRKKAFKWWAFATLLAGYALYLVGFYWEGTRQSFLAYLFRPLLSSLEMFVSHSDLIEVDGQCKANPYYMAAFSLVHFSAVAVSASFAINCFWRRIVFWFRRKAWQLFPLRGTVDVFFGLDDRSLALARNLHACRNRAEGERMVFVDLPDEGHSSARRLSFSHIFGLFSYKAEQVRAVGCLYPVLMHCALPPHKAENAGPGVLDALELQSLRRILRNASAVRLFFLSQEEEDNIKAALLLVQDRAFARCRPVVYCRARRNAVNEAVYGVGAAEIHLVDESELAVEALKLMPAEAGHPERGYRAHPVRFVGVDRMQGCATSAFTALIVGLGDTGQDALRFLYEFGAFAGPQGQKSPFRLYAVDRRMEQIKGKLFREIPALPALADEVELIGEDAASPGFWRRMGEIVDCLNYVVIALGNDEAGIALAAEICRYAVQNRRGGLEKFGIFVRSYEPENETRLRRTAEYYGQDGREPIAVFGTRGEIYSKQMVVDSGLQEQAKRFYASYARCTCPSGRFLSWEARRAQLLGGAPCGTLPLCKQELYRKEFQDEENCIHAYTKQCLADPGLLQGGLPAVGDFLAYLEGRPVAPAEAGRYGCLLNLSIGEHLRWNASHLMLGYVAMSPGEAAAAASSCDEVRKKHKYLVDWAALPASTQVYDYAVVYTTFTESSAAPRGC